MTLVRRPSPLGELVSLRQAMDRLFEDGFSRPFTWATNAPERFGLALDMTSGPDELVVQAALPGVRPEDVEITVENGTLSIHADSHSERSVGEGEALVQEIRRGSVSRVIALPTGLEPDKASATFEHGMLTLRIPRAETVKPHQIRITPTVEPHTDDAPTDPADGRAATATGAGTDA